MKAYHKFISGLLTACMTLTCFPALLANAEDVPDAVEWNGHKYAVIQQELTPIEANQYCQSLGGYLATITSADEQAFVAYLASQVDWEAFFIGGSDENSEGEWYWLNGETWTIQHGIRAVQSEKQNPITAMVQEKIMYSWTGHANISGWMCSAVMITILQGHISSANGANLKIQQKALGTGILISISIPA